MRSIRDKKRKEMWKEANNEESERRWNDAGQNGQEGKSERKNDWKHIEIKMHKDKAYQCRQ